MLAALAESADAGPTPIAVVNAIAETAVGLVTPKLVKTGNMVIISNIPKPAADGIHINNNWPKGTIKAAAR